MKTNWNGLSYFTSSSLGSLFLFLSIQLGTIRILKVGPKPYWILPGNGWLAGYQEAFQSGIILMNFSRSKVWPEDLQVQKLNLVSVPEFVWLRVRGWLMWTKLTKYQNFSPKYHTSIGNRMCVRKSRYSHSSPQHCSPWRKSTQK